MMNNEEKILSMLETVIQGQANMAVRLDSLEKRFDSLEKRFDSLEKRFDSLETRFDNLEAKVDRNYNHLLDLEALNGKRHIEMMDLISKNTNTINYLRAIK